MFKLSSEFKERYYNFIYKYFNLEKDIKLLPIDFNKPWYQILLDQKRNLILQFISEVLQSVFGAVTPLILGTAFFTGKIDYLYYFVVGYIALEILNRYIIRYLIVLVLTSSNSISKAAYQYFLTVDPIYHSTKSSGQIISKVQKANSDLEMLISQVFIGFLSTVVGFIAVVVALGSFNSLLGIIGAISFVLIAISNGGINYVNAETFKKRGILAEDKAKSESVETLQQNALIRASFASNEQINKLEKSMLKSVGITSLATQSFGITRTITRIIYSLSTFLIGLVIFNLVETGQLNSGIGISLLLAYFSGSAQILRVGDMIRNIVEMAGRQEDLFEFIRQFGLQTYPVLEGDEIEDSFEDGLKMLEEKQKIYLENKI